MRVRSILRAQAEGSRLGDPQALRAAYDAYGSELYRFARRQLGDDGAAQDVVQEVFLRAWRSSSSFDPEVASLRVWLYAIARNAVIDEARRRSVRPISADTPVDDQVAGRLPHLRRLRRHSAGRRQARDLRRRVRPRRRQLPRQRRGDRSADRLTSLRPPRGG